MPAISKHQRFSELPPEYPNNLMPIIANAIAKSQDKIVVLDDDPTGTQTVHDVPVLTRWTLDVLMTETDGTSSLFYILTNTRALPLAQAQAINREIGLALRQCRPKGRMIVMSRGDSTLRGHYPGEIEALCAALGDDFDATLIIPAFCEGGRYTIDDIHYVAEGDQLVPTGETPFARDPAFGYRASNLREWVTEKTSGRVSANDVMTISLDTIRREGPEGVLARLLSFPRGSVCVFNAASHRDLEVAVLSIMQAENAGKRYLYRTAATMVAIRGGLEARPLLTAHDLHLPGNAGGLIVVGSFVPKTSCQLDHLLCNTDVHPIEVSVPDLLDDERSITELARVAAAANTALAQQQTVVIYTSRTLLSGTDGEASLPIGQHISDSLVTIMQHIKERPRFLIAKGGITSSDIATKALKVRRAIVQGQVLPGVPVWELGAESRYPGMRYIIFPGNVGGDEALTHVVQMLQPITKEGKTRVDVNSNN